MSERRFYLSEDHLKLLQRARVGWNEAEFGAPEIDPERPYGNSDVLDDVVEILCGENIAKQVRKESEWSSDYHPLHTLALAVHHETEIALQIVLSTRSFEPGWYATDDYGSTWVRVGENE